MLGTVVNTVAILAGAIIGLLVKKGFSENLADTLMKGLGLCTLYLGISGSLKGENALILILSVVIGTLIGSALKLEDKVGNMGIRLETKFNRNGNAKVSIAEGFVTSSLLFCVGAMAVIGSLQAGLTHDYSMLFNKSVLDFVSSIIFASTLGIGVMFAAAAVFLYQGAITMLAQWMSPLLSSDKVINEMTCVGSVLIIGLALNMLGVTKLKIMNYLPAVFVPIILCRFL